MYGEKLTLNYIRGNEDYYVSSPSYSAHTSEIGTSEISEIKKNY